MAVEVRAVEVVYRWYREEDDDKRMPRPKRQMEEEATARVKAVQAEAWAVEGREDTGE